MKHAVFSEGRPRVAVFLMPGGQAGGMLEDLCQLAVRSDPAAPFVDAYFERLEEAIAKLDAAGQALAADRLRQTENVRAKAWAHAFLASRPRPDKRVGEAAQSHYWPFDAPAFAPLLDLLRGL